MLISTDSPTAFLAPALPTTARSTARPTACPTMSGKSHSTGAAVTRRAALAALAAAVAGVATGTGPASAGSAAKQSIFGYGGASSPYSYADKSTGTVLYKVRVGAGGLGKICDQLVVFNGGGALG